MQKFIFIMALLVLLINPLYGFEWDGCGGDADSSVASLVFSPIDTVHGIMVFAIYPEEVDSLGSDTLYTYMHDFGDTSGHTPGQILKNSSFGKLIVTHDVNPGLNGKFLVLPHTRAEYNALSNYDTTGYYPSNLWLMATDVVIGLDSLIDYGNYDQNNDGIVDYVTIFYKSFSLYYVGGGWIGVPKIKFSDGTHYYTTNDTSDTGTIIRVEGLDRGQTQRAAGGYFSAKFVYSAIMAHEFIHNVNSTLFTWIDYWGYYSTGFHNTVSIFDVAFPTTGGRRGSYFQPYWAEKAGWLIEDNIQESNSPIYSCTLGDYITTGNICKVPISSKQYFLLTNRQRLSLNEVQWPCKGLFIWHINDSIRWDSQKNLSHKTEDLEIPGGLFLLNSDSTGIIAAPDSGYDEIDFRNWFARDTTSTDSLLEYLIDVTNANWGDSTDSYIPPMDTVFDCTTNPNSNLYDSSGGKWYQNVPSHFSIRNLTQDPNDSTVLIMDVLLNHWQDSLTANTIWGDTAKATGYAITGDFIIPAGDTLTIREGTKIYFQADEDDKQSGYTQTQCELIVYGTLIVEGDSTNHVEFIPSSEQLGTASAYDWYGIRFMAGSRGTMDYCDIKYARYGIYAYSNATVELDNCNIEDCYTIGIFSTGGILSVNNTTFDGAGSCGIYSTYSQTEVDSCEFTDCDTYGIYCYGTPDDSLDSSVISYCTISNDSNYGIRVSYNDDISIIGNNVTASTACLYLYNSDATVKHDTLQSIGTYGIYISASDADVDSCLIKTISYLYELANGIYVTGTSSPTIDACRFDYTTTGVYINGTATPNLGYCGAAICTGYNDLEVCSNYYIYQNSTTQPLISAENNYYSSSIYTGKFYGNIDYKPVLTTDPFLKQLLSGELPSSYSLNSNYPNPFNPTTNFSFSLAEAGNTTIEIFNVLGQKINTLVDEYMPAGEHTVIWNGTNGAGQQVSSGVYFYKITSGDYTETKKMSLLR